MEKIAVIGLGYVGLPLAVEFGKKYRVIGYDINEDRINELRQCRDHTLEADLDSLRQATELYKNSQQKGLSFSCNEDDIKACDIYSYCTHTYRRLQHTESATTDKSLGNSG